MKSPFQRPVNGRSVEGAAGNTGAFSLRAAGRLSGPGLASKPKAADTFRSGATMGLEVPHIH